jgi:hypothetical protein
MSKSILVINNPETCGECPFCIFTAEEKNYIGYCHTSDDDFYCKLLDRFMEYDKVDGGVDILGKPTDCPLQVESEVPCFCTDVDDVSKGFEEFTKMMFKQGNNKAESEDKNDKTFL